MEYTHATIETNGVRLHVVQAGPEDGPLALVLHGFPDFWYGWKAQIDALLAALPNALARDRDVSRSRTDLVVLPSPP